MKTQIETSIRNFIHKANLLFQPKSFHYYGNEIYFPKGSFIYEKLLNDGYYERENLEIIIGSIKENTTYIDIGANIGLMTVPILSLCPSCNVLSFEPSPNTVEYLKTTLQHSNFRDRWEVIDRAVGSEVGELEFCMAAPALGAYDGFRNTRRMSMEKTIVVPVTTLDTEWKSHGKPKVSFIKIDTEGAEIAVLKGGIECITTERPRILLEWNAKNLSAYGVPIDTLIEFARQNDYFIHSSPYMVPVENLKELEIQMLRNENFILTSK